MLSGMASILRIIRNCEGIIKLCTFSFNSLQIRSMDSTIMCALTLRTTFFQYKINGEPRTQEPWKQTLTGLLDTLVYWCISSWLWKLLGVSLLMPHKGDILKKRYNSCTYTKYHCPKLSSFIVMLRVNLNEWYGRGIQLVTWTVNSNAEKQHFESVLQIAYMTDSVNIENEVGEQNS